MSPENCNVDIIINGIKFPLKSGPTFGFNVVLDDDEEGYVAEPVVNVRLLLTIIPEKYLNEIARMVVLEREKRGLE